MATENETDATTESKVPARLIEQQRHADGTGLYRIGLGPKGRGLFATQAIPPRTLLHVAPCIRITKHEYESHMRFTILEHYLFNDRRSHDKLLALGVGSLFNHSNHPNVDYRVVTTEEENSEIRFWSGHRIIDCGDELCISYGANLWFDDADSLESTSNASHEQHEDGSTDMDFLERLQV